MVLKIVILTTALGFAVVQLDVSIVNVALATIARDLHSTIAGLQWIVDAYTIAFAALLLTAGSLADRFGGRRMFMVAFLIFGCASLCCALAPNVAALIAARLAQGVGAALLVPSSLALINHTAHGDGKARAHAIALWTAGGSIGIASGPIVGGFLIAATTWRSIFFVNVPITLVGLALAWYTLKDTPRADGTFDLFGQGLAIATLASLTGAVIAAGAFGWLSPIVAALFAFGAISAILFALCERDAPHPMLPLDFFEDASVTAPVAIGLAINFTLYGVIFVLSLFMQRTLGYSALQTGLAFLLPFLSLGVANVLAGSLVTQYGSWRPLGAGLIVASLGFAALLVANGSSTYPDLVVGLLVFPFGIGIAVPSMTTTLLASVERSRSGLASGVLNTVRQSAGAMGVALFGTLITTDMVGGFHAVLSISAVAAMLAGICALLGASRRGAEAA